MAITPEQHLRKIQGIEKEIQKNAGYLGQEGLSEYRKADFNARIGRRVSALSKELGYTGRLGTKIDPEMQARLERYSTDYKGALKDAQAREKENAKIIAEENARNAKVAPSTYSAGTVNKQGTSGGKTFASPTEFLDRKAQQAQDRAAYVRERSGGTAPIPQTQNIKPFPSITSKSAPVLREQQKEDSVRQSIMEQRGITDMSQIPLSTQTLIDEAVNTQVYGMSRPNFKIGSDVLNTSQKAQEMSIEADRAAQAAKDEILAQPDPIRSSVITSDAARGFTDEQYRTLDRMQLESTATSNDAIGNLLSSDADVMAAQFAGEDAMNLLEEKRNFYAKTYEESLNQIKQAFDDKEAGAREAAKVSMGQTVAMLARMGALGTTTAGAQYVSDVERENNAKLMSFAAEEAAAIQTAYEAYQTADFDVAEKMIGVAEKTRIEIRQIKSDQLNQQVQRMQLKQMETEDSNATLQNLIDAGMTEADLPPDYLYHLDAQRGVPYGTSSKLMQVAENQKVAEAAVSQQDAEVKSLENFKTLQGVLSEMPPDQYVDFNGGRYYGSKSNNQFQGTEIDKATGDVLGIFYNEQTGEMSVNRQKGVLTPNVSYSIQNITNPDGTVSKWYVPDDPMQGPAVPVTGGQFGGAQGVNDGTIQQNFPEGTSYSDVASTGQYSEKDFWCLRFIGNMDARGDAFINEIGDTIDEKAASADPAIGFGEGQRPPGIGDYILTNEDSNYGHIALITDIRTDPNTGKQVAVLTESNYKPLTVTHSRTLELTPENMSRSGGSVMGFVRSQLKPEYTSQSPAGLTSYEGSAGLDQTVIDAYARKVASGDVAIGSVPDNYRNSVIVASETVAPQTEVRLTEADITKVDKTPESKKLIALADMSSKVKNYRDLIEQYGFSIVSPRQKTLLEGAYADALLSWKTVAELGALAGPDIEIINLALKPVTGLGSAAKAGFNSKNIVESLDNALASSAVGAEQNYNRLLARDERYANADYIKLLGEPFSVRVREKTTGQVGSIPISEFDEVLYERVK